MPNDIIFLDAETYYDNDYSLRKMTPAEYILDRRFQEIMWAVKVHRRDGSVIPNQIIEPQDFKLWLSQFNPDTTTTVVFNALFDNAILAWRHGFVPHTMLCTMAMSRTLFGHELVRFSLASIADFFQLPAKGTAISDVKGMTTGDIKARGLWNAFCDYALHDNEINEHIFWRMLPLLPKAERRLLDMVLRCCIEPRFVVNTALLDAHIRQVQKDKADMLVAAGNVDKKDIMSTAKFKAALEALGVQIEYKTTPTGNQSPAFAKSDKFMEELQNSDDPAVAALATARIGLKSTLEETRSATLWRIGQLPWSTMPDGMPRLYSGGTMPVPLRYGGAHTHRLSGDWGMNMQNLPRPKKDENGNEVSQLRYSLEAPPGHSVVTCDLGQIEARLVAWLCRALTLIEEFAKYDAGDKAYDPYNRLATAVFGQPVDRKLKDPMQQIMGFIGKTGILGLGYGCGKDNFNTMVLRNARAQKMDVSLVYNREVGDKAVDTYRTRYWQIPQGWQVLNNAIRDVWSRPSTVPRVFGPCEITFGEVKLPSGLSLQYADPQEVWDPNTGRTEYRYRYGKTWHRLYGAKLLENISQALGRVLVMNAALRIRAAGSKTPYPWAFRFVLQAHDELVYIVPNEIRDEAKKIIHAEMVRRPSWAKDLPLTADIKHGKSYGEAK